MRESRHGSNMKTLHTIRRLKLKTQRAHIHNGKTLETLANMVYEKIQETRNKRKIFKGRKK